MKLAALPERKVNLKHVALADVRLNSLNSLLEYRLRHRRNEPGQTFDVDSELIVQVRTVVCDAADHAACYPLSNAFRIPLRLLAEGQAPQAELRVPLALELGAVR